MAHAIHHPSSSREVPSDTHRRSGWSAALWAGVVAGGVFMMAEMLLVWLALGQSPWGPQRMIAAMVLGRDVLPPPADFSLPVMATAMAIHFPLSMLYGVAIGLLAYRFGMVMAVVVGLAFSLVAIY